MKGSPSKQGLGRAVVAQHLRQQQAGGGLGAQAQVHKGQREGRVVARIDQIAVQQQVVPMPTAGPQTAASMGLLKPTKARRNWKTAASSFGRWVV